MVYSSYLGALGLPRRHWTESDGVGLSVVSWLFCDPMDCSLPGPSVHGIPRQEYWYPCPPPGDLPDLGIEPKSPHCRWNLYHLSHRGASGKEPPANSGDPRDVGSIPGSGEGNGNQLQYSCLENPMDRGAWQATVHGVSKSQTWLNDLAQMLKLSWQWPMCSNSYSFSLQIINSLKAKAGFLFCFVLFFPLYL